MSITVIVSLQVEDFDRWKALFDEGVSIREEAGIHATAYKELGDANRAHAIGTAPSREAFFALFSNPELQQRQRDAGVKFPPDVKILEEA